MKRGLAFLFIGLLLVSIVSAQFGNAENQIEGFSEGLENNLTKAKEFTTADRWNFMGLQWKEFLLKNKVIAGVDAFFTKINIVFVILFALSWSISIEMLFVFLLWIFTLFSIYGYLSFKDKNLRWGVSVAATIALAHAKLYSFISSLMIKIILFRPSTLWKSLTFILVICGFVLYLMINKVISKSLEKSREKKEKEDLEFRVKKTETFQNSVQEAERESGR